MPSSNLPKMFQLTIQSPGGETDSYLLNREHLTLGSNPDCDIVIPSPAVAPLAARLTWEDGQGFRLLTAPGQRSFTVNGQPVLSAILEEGDQIQAGDFLGTLHTVAEPPAAAWELPDSESSPSAETLPIPTGAPAPGEAAPAPGAGELPALRAELADLRQVFREASAQLEQLRAENQSLHAEVSAYREASGASLQVPDLLKRISDLEQRLRETETDARRRIARAHETAAILRRAITQQDGELRVHRQTLLRLRQAKDAAETRLESVRKSYSRDRKQHGRLLDQFRERARRETARADMALDELARTRPPEEATD